MELTVEQKKELAGEISRKLLEVLSHYGAELRGECDYGCDVEIVIDNAVVGEFDPKGQKGQ